MRVEKELSQSGRKEPAAYLWNPALRNFELVAKSPGRSLNLTLTEHAANAEASEHILTEWL